MLVYSRLCKLPPDAQLGFPNNVPGGSFVILFYATLNEIAYFSLNPFLPQPVLNAVSVQLTPI